MSSLPVDERPLDKHASHRLLLICLLVVLASGFLVSQIQQSFGAVQVRDIKIPTHNGQWVAGDLFKPKSATSENPAPFIVVVPGFQRSKESLSNIALELARRGFVTLSIDPYAQGGSSASLSRIAATTEGYGMFAVVDYAASSSNLNYIDRNRIGAGHICRNDRLDQVDAPQRQHDTGDAGDHGEQTGLGE